ncbi:MAG: hypothetical protein ACYDB2_03760 [Acidimicrobiales bacterium]
MDGSFTPSPYTSMALSTPSQGSSGVAAGKPVSVQLTNRTGHARTYHWSATQKGALVSLGEETLGSGRSTTVFVPSLGAATGVLRIGITGTNIFVTVPILKS